MRLLLVEDDPMLGESVQQGLRKSGFFADWVQDGEAADRALRDNPYALLLLDLMLPKKSGLDVLRHLRKSNNPIPVLILTARDEVDDRIAGLDAGADDYLVKPFQLGELAARIRALLRRQAGRAEPLLVHGDLSLNPATHEVEYQGRRQVLAAREFALLSALMEKPGVILSRAQLEERLYGWDDEVESNTVEVHIHRLRKKLDPDLIRNIRGVGYLMPKER